MLNLSDRPRDVPLPAPAGQVLLRSSDDVTVDGRTAHLPAGATTVVTTSRRG